MLWGLGRRRYLAPAAVPVSTGNLPRNPSRDGEKRRQSRFCARLPSTPHGTGSSLDWTIVRPPRLTDKPLTGAYRTAYGQNLRGGFFISRADVADLMLRVLEQPDTT